MSRVNQLGLCINCMKAEHQTEACNSRNCKLCDKKHNTLLHTFFDKPIINNNPSHGQPSSTVDRPSVCCTTTNTQIILSTAIVFMKDTRGIYHKSRVLLDSAAQSNFMTANFAETLGLSKTPINTSVSGLGDMTTKIKYQVEALVSSKLNNYERVMDFLVVPSITKLLPSQRLQLRDVIPAHIQLADPEFHVPSQIDALIGGELFLHLIRDGQICLETDQIVLQNSVFGYIAGGKTSSCKTFAFTTIDSDLQSTELLKAVNRFWELDNVNTNKILSSEENDAECHFLQTHTRDNNGRYTIRLAFRDNKSELGESFDIAQKRFQYLESKLQRSPELKQQYTDFINEYLKMGHMSIASDQQLNKSSNNHVVQYVMPHHAILKPSSSTTKLNNILMVGPCIQDELFSIILRFQKHIYAFTADVEKMYRMIIVHEEDRKFQQILWRSDPKDELQLYELNTVTYGTSSAPFLATRVLQQISIDEANNYPIASKAIDDFYMDDVMSGSDNIEKAIELQTQLIEMLKSGGMKLRKFSSNCLQILNQVPEYDREQKVSLDGSDATNPITALGLIWNPEKDTFSFNIQQCQKHKFLTKRIVLSKLAKTFDPLGLLSPIIFKAKVFLQDLWLQKLDWDDRLRQEDQYFWNEYHLQFENLQALHLYRCVMNNKPTRIELHGFGDASKKAYGAVLYVRCFDQNNLVSVNILCSKSKVAPLKKTTIPRLELCAALLLARLTIKAVELMKIQFDDIYLWSDSTIVLSWLKSPANHMKTFVGNRVSEIQDMPLPVRWSYIESANNPADLVSRGLMPTEIIDQRLWWMGPPFLRQPFQTELIDIPDESNNQEFINEFEQGTVHTILVATNHINDIIEECDSFNEALNVMSYALRFLKLTETSSSTQSITPSEREAALKMLVRLVQNQVFAAEIRDLKSKKEVATSSPLRKLSPFLDKDDLIRVGGRIGNSELPFETKHQLVLPKRHHLSDLIFLHYHIANLHSGAQSLLNHIRQRFMFEML